MSCADNELPVSIENDEEIPAMFTDGYALNFVVTLDNMGGSTDMRATSAEHGTEEEYGENPYAELENYIDPEKFRVLFFDSKDRFLFESKSRWVKKIIPNDENDHSEWFVSVPIYAYGNDEEEGWEWEKIREVLTGTSKDAEYDAENKVAFKIALLVNRPKTEWNMGIKGKPDGTNENSNHILTPGDWTLANGPFWNANNTIWGDKPKEIFDLHHCQYDPIYDGKNFDEKSYDKNQTDYDKETNAREHYVNYGIYDFITGTVEDGDGIDSQYKGRPTMGATSTWVDWSNSGQNYVTINGAATKYRRFVSLSEEHPIPMYGIQSFDKITDWVKGTPFNLSKITENQPNEDYNFKAISLLRSVVKLELVLPFEPEYLLIFYPNVYARCEPMDVWTPTNEIWEEELRNCEFYDIAKYGPIARKDDPIAAKRGEVTLKEAATSIPLYRQRLSWFYGIWQEKGKWKLEAAAKQVTRNTENATIPAFPSAENPIPEGPYPKIFNSCIQRNTAAYCKDANHYVRGNMHHYVIYTGERNINDPSAMVNIGETNSGNPTVAYWMFPHGNVGYCIPFASYDGMSNVIDNDKGPVITDSKYGTGKTAPTGGLINKYELSVMAYTQNGPPMPWPLLRNHVYRIQINQIQNRSTGAGGLSISSKHLYSESINFDKQRKEKEAKKKETEKK